MSSRANFCDTKLAPIERWGNTLDGGTLNNSETKLANASKMWETLGCGTLQDYHDPYLKLNCELLASVCEFHRELSFTTYELDCMHIFTLPNIVKKAPDSAVASPLSTKTGP